MFPFILRFNWLILEILEKESIRTGGSGGVTALLGTRICRLSDTGSFSPLSFPPPPSPLAPPAAETIIKWLCAFELQYSFPLLELQETTKVSQCQSTTSIHTAQHLELLKPEVS